MRLVNKLSEKTHVFGMGFFFELIDKHILENSNIDKIHWTLQFGLIVTIVVPFMLLAFIMVIIIMGSHGIERVSANLIYRHKIELPRPKDNKFYANMNTDFGCRYNMHRDFDHNIIVVYFLKEKDLGWFILKYSDFIVKKT